MVVDTEESKVVQEREKIVIKQIVDQKIREVVDDPTLKLSETKLVSEVIEKLNVPKAKAEEIIAVLVRESPQIEAQKTDGELGQRIDQINEDQTAEKIYVGMIESGATVREAQRAMDFMREMEPSTKEVAVCRQTLERNGYSPNNEAATEQAISFKHLVTSKTKFSENLETIKSITNRIGGLNKTVLSIGKDGDKKAGSVAKKVANLEQVQKFFEKNPAIVKSVERIQQLLNTRNLVYKAVGWTVEKMGMTGAVEGIKTFGIEMATKYGGQWAGAMATHFAEYGSLSVEGGIQSIVRQLLSKGATTAVKAGATATAEGAAAAAGGAAAATAEGAVVAAEATNPVGWIMLAIEAVLIVGKWLWDKGTKAIQWFFEETGIKPGEALAGLGIAVATGATTIATTMISIPAMMSSAVLSPWLLGGLLVAVPVYNYIQTTEKMTSPLVMNMGNNGDESSVPTTPGSGGYNPGAPGLPGEDLPGSSCSVADKVVLTKQNAPPWGSMALPQGCSFANAACGPTCVSMILRHGNGSYTPNTVVYGPLNGKSSPYGGLGCDGSGFGEAISAYNIMGISASGVRTCSQTDIYNWICQGKVVMILADFYKNNEGGFGGHYVLGVATKDKKIFTADPYYTNIRGSEGGLNPSFDGGGVGHIAPGRTPTCVTIDAASIP